MLSRSHPNGLPTIIEQYTSGASFRWMEGEAVATKTCHN